MPRHVEDPTVSRKDGETIESHPAYAQISASRVSGYTSLYGSDFRHQNSVTIRIAHSSVRRSLSTDWHRAGKEIVEVSLSEAQWAAFVSSLNVGSGVPCTLDHIQGEMMPALPDPKKRVDQFAGEVKAKMAKAIDSLKAAMREVDELGLSKAKAAAMKSRIATAEQELRANLPFVAEMFDEHMETTVEKAKAEVHGYMTGVIQRAGFEAIAGNLPLQIEHKGDGDE